MNDDPLGDIGDDEDAADWREAAKKDQIATISAERGLRLIRAAFKMESSGSFTITDLVLEAGLDDGEDDPPISAEADARALIIAGVLAQDPDEHGAFMPSRDAADRYAAAGAAAVLRWATGQTEQAEQAAPPTESTEKPIVAAPVDAAELRELREQHQVLLQWLSERGVDPSTILAPPPAPPAAAAPVNPLAFEWTKTVRVGPAEKAEILDEIMGIESQVAESAARVEAAKGKLDEAKGAHRRVEEAAQARLVDLKTAARFGVRVLRFQALRVPDPARGLMIIKDAKTGAELGTEALPEGTQLAIQGAEDLAVYPRTSTPITIERFRNEVLAVVVDRTAIADLPALVGEHANLPVGYSTAAMVREAARQLVAEGVLSGDDVAVWPKAGAVAVRQAAPAPALAHPGAAPAKSAKQRLLDAIRSGAHTRAEIVEQGKLSEAEWRSAIKDAQAESLVRTSGTTRGTKYHLASEPG